MIAATSSKALLASIPPQLVPTLKLLRLGVRAVEIAVQHHQRRRRLPQPLDVRSD